jgi:hypothetical protein
MPQKVIPYASPPRPTYLVLHAAGGEDALPGVTGVAHQARHVVPRPLPLPLRAGHLQQQRRPTTLTLALALARGRQVKHVDGPVTVPEGTNEGSANETSVGPGPTRTLKTERPGSRLGRPPLLSTIARSGSTVFVWRTYPATMRGDPSVARDAATAVTVRSTDGS